MHQKVYLEREVGTQLTPVIENISALGLFQTTMDVDCFFFTVAFSLYVIGQCFDHDKK